MKRRILLLALLVAPAMALAHSTKLGDIAIGHAWALPSDNGETSAMMPMVNAGADDALIGATSAAAEKIELRGADNATVVRFDLPKDKPFPMRPKGPHLQLLGLKAPLKIGDRIPLTLIFEKAGKIDMELHVETTPGT